jgi:ABC-type antimicrobial peptide transport system permease subunit
VGIFSVLMFMVQQRAREFSVRLAVGASAGDLLRLVLGGGLKLTAIGVALGVAASAALVRSLTTLLFGVPPLESADVRRRAAVVDGRRTARVSRARGSRAARRSRGGPAGRITAISDL